MGDLCQFFLKVRIPQKFRGFYSDFAWIFWVFINSHP